MNSTTTTPRTGSTGNVIAALCNVFVPGLGQLIQARILLALFFFVATWTCYTLAAVGAIAVLPLLLYIPGAILHLISIVSAATWRGK